MADKETPWVSIKEHGPPDKGSWCWITSKEYDTLRTDCVQYASPALRGIDGDYLWSDRHGWVWKTEEVLAYVVLPEPYEGE